MVQVFRKAMIFFVFLGGSQSALAVQLTVQNPCSAELWLSHSARLDGPETVGSVTVMGLTTNGIPFVGDKSGISSIRGTVTGDAALEVISDTEMRAYGWCYSFNGIDPALMPDQVPVKKNNDSIYWYFGFAHYKGGEWISYCTPTHSSKPEYVCRN